MEIIAQILGLFGAGFNIGSFQIKNSRKLIFFQFLGSSFFLTNYLLLGAFTGCFMNLMGVVRGVVFLSGEKWRKIPVLVSLNALLILGTILTWEGLLSLLPLIGMLAMTTTMFFGNGKYIRIAQLFISSPCWLVYNSASRTVGGTVCELFVIASTVVSFARYGFDGFEK